MQLSQDINRMGKKIITSINILLNRCLARICEEAKDSKKSLHSLLPMAIKMTF